MSSELESYLDRPLAPVDPEAAAAVAAGPMDPADALALGGHRPAARPAGDGGGNGLVHAG